MRSISSLALILLAATAASAQTQPQSSTQTLEERMSQAEFHAAGLNKLSPEELHQLNAWLQNHGAATPTIKVVGTNGQPVFYPHESERETVESHLAGSFSGWTGHSVFTLDNGQQWQQAESGAYDSGKLDHPAVKIKPMLLGSWLMYVDGCGCSVRVKRVK
jgi:hypothetical protein